MPKVLNTTNARELLRSVDLDERGEGAKRIILDFASKRSLESMLDQVCFIVNIVRSSIRNVDDVIVCIKRLVEY